MTPFYAFESQLESDPEQLHKTPRVAHLVIFFKCQLPVPCSRVKLRLQQREVEATAWVDKTEIGQILSRDEQVRYIPIEHSVELVTSCIEKKR